MSRSIGRLRFWFSLAFALLAAGSGAAMAAEAVVVESRGISLKAGDTIDTDANLTLALGQKLTLITADGDTVKLVGPFEGVPTAATAGDTGSVVASLSGLATQKSVSAVSVGVVRANEGPKLPEPWLVDVSRSGDRCLIEGAPVVFWNPGAKGIDPMELTSLDRSWRARAQWPAEADRIILSSKIVIRDGQTYRVQTGKTAASITIHLIPGSVARDEMRAAWMLQKRCDPQVAALLARRAS